MITREEAMELLLAQGPEQHLVHHALETEAVMRGVAARLGRDVDLWGLAGLLHDLDYPQTKDDPSRHGITTAEMLQGRLPDEALQAIRGHACELNGSAGPASDFDYALRAAETVTGLVSANAMVRPERMAGMSAKSLKKKMKEKAFAASVNREIIRECEKLGLELGEFFDISVASITPMADQVGLA